jgi:hypothetical protein
MAGNSPAEAENFRRKCLYQTNKTPENKMSVQAQVKIFVILFPLDPVS